ncbi:hypothetical protein HK096_007436 [Nowakowskiella sp. JEL0078]|nr:hypothetical protein HK096_007436 [Nowakowskiella sp. JEL0078]
MPLFLDWRCRIYVSNLSLNYQSSDFSSSLVQLFHGSALSKSGFFWLRVHGANCYGKDKLSFDNRVKFIDSVHDSIMSLDSSFILKADSPIKFAAFCLTYRAYINDPSTIIRPPVFLDATCSGLQHIAALLGDAALGELVNLKGDTRRDLYAEIYMVPTLNGDTVELTYKDLYCIATVIYETVYNNYESIREIFAYLIDWVKLANKINMCLSWVTPSGTIITPKYLASKQSRHSISMNQRAFKLVYYQLVKPEE